MEGQSFPESPTPPPLRLQATTTPGSTAPSLSPSLKLDEGYSDETRSQSDKDLGPDNALMLPDWVLAQSEADRAGEYFSPRLPLTNPKSHAPATFGLSAC